MWLNQDTITYYYDFQLYGFDFTKATTIDEESKYPENYKISINNYPNPFNNSTTIEVTFPQTFKVNNIYIDIYNTNGQFIQLLSRYRKQNNTAIFKWYSQSSYLNISSGVYLMNLYSIENDKKRKLKSHKIILVK